MNWLLCKIGLHNWAVISPNERRYCIHCNRWQTYTLVDGGMRKIWLTDY